MKSPYELSRGELAALVPGQPDYRVDQIWRGLWDEALAIEEITTIPKALRADLATSIGSSLTRIEDVTSDQGATRRWVFALGDGATIETVLMAYADRVTVCVSTQAGCAMACSFCATGQAGFTRQLTLGEVLDQVMAAVRAAAPRRVSNVVFMGMGEPLANYPVTVGALRALHEHRGLSARHLTVSTVGVAPAIERLAGEGLAVTLAVSLHAANDELRSEIVPINRRYPLARLARACETWVHATGRRLSFEWALIEDVNDTDRAAHELAAYATPLRAHVNVIPLNPTPGYLARGPSPERVRAFCDLVASLGVNVTVRNTRGRSIDAACGQLARVTAGRRRSIPVRS